MFGRRHEGSRTFRSEGMEQGKGEQASGFRPSGNDADAPDIDAGDPGVLASKETITA